MGEFFGSAVLGTSGVPATGMGSSGFFNVPSPNFHLAPLLPVDGGAAVGLTLQAVQCSDDGLHAVALGVDNGTGDLRAVYSSDSGNTWTVAGGFPIIAGGTGAFSGGLQPIAFHGLIAVALVQAGGNNVIASSADGGQTWTNTTPATATPTGPIYSRVAGAFLWFDSTNNLVWSAADGTTWVSTALPASIDAAQFLENAAGTALIAYVSVAPDNHAEMWSSADGATWISRLVVAGTTSTPAYIPFVFHPTRNEFAATFLHDIDFGYDFYASNAAGTAWTLKSTGFQPPPDATPAVFKHLYYTNSNSPSFYISADGATWTPEAITNPYLVNNTWQLSGTGVILILYGPNVAATPDGINFGPLVLFEASGNVSAMAATPAGGGYTLGVGVTDAGLGHIWRFAA